MCVCVCIYIYIYTHTHTHTQSYIAPKYFGIIYALLRELYTKI